MKLTNQRWIKQTMIDNRSMQSHWNRSGKWLKNCHNWLLFLHKSRSVTKPSCRECNWNHILFNFGFKYIQNQDRLDFRQNFIRTNVLSIIVFPVKLALITTQTEPELLNFKPIAKFIGISTNSAKRWVEFWDTLAIKLSVANLKCDP